MAASDGIVCDICGGSHDAECCPELGLGESFMEQEVSRARRSLPNDLTMVEYPDQSMDVIAKVVIPAKTRFGPFEAKECVPSEPESDCIFYLKVFHKDGSVVMLDATCEDDCNWLSLVRVAQSSSEQNCIAYQMGRSIFYNATKQIEIDEILRVWYAPYYAQKMAKSSEPDGATKSMLQAVMENLALEDNVMVVEQIIVGDDGVAGDPQSLSGSMETNAAGDLIIHLDSNNPDSGSIMYTALDMVELGADNKKAAYDHDGQSEIRSAELSLLALNGGSSETPTLITDYSTSTEIRSCDGNVIILESKRDFNEKYEERMEVRLQVAKPRQIDKIITSHDSMSYKCSKCDSVFDDQKNLAVHLCEHISSDMVKYSGIVCSHCGQSFKNRMFLHKHIKSNHKEAWRSHKCTECDFVTTRPGFLTLHMKRNHTGIKDTENIFCEQRLENNQLDKSCDDVSCEGSTRIADEDPASLTKQVTEADNVDDNKDVETKSMSGLKRKTLSSVSLCAKVFKMGSTGTKVSLKRSSEDGENCLRNQPTVECELTTSMQQTSAGKSRSGAVKKPNPAISEAAQLDPVIDSLVEPWMSPSCHLPVRINRGNRLRDALDGCRPRTIKKEPLSPVADEIKAFTFDKKTDDAEIQNVSSVIRKRGRPRKSIYLEDNVSTSEKTSLTLMNTSLASENTSVTLEKTALASEQTWRHKVIKGKGKAITVSITSDRGDKQRDDLNEISEQELTDKSSESLDRSTRKSRGVNKKYNSEYVVVTKNSSNLAADNDDEAAAAAADDDELQDFVNKPNGVVKHYKGKRGRKRAVVNSDIADKAIDESGKDIFTCKICSKAFKNYKYLTMHYTVHTEKFHCQICDKTYGRRESILNHRCDGIITCQGDAGFPFMYECVECDKIFNDGKLAKVHTLTHVGQYRCSSCSKSFRRQYKLDAHVCVSRGKEEKITDPASAFVCEICGTVFDRLPNLHRHMTMHTEIYKCDGCHKTFSRKDSWQRHILRCNPEQADKEGVYCCTNCGKGFATLLGKDNHMLRCKAGRTKICRVCLKSLPDNIEQGDNWADFCSCPPATSKDKLRFKCSLCTRVFASEKYLERHEAAHTGAFACTRCTKAFSRKEECDWHALQCDAREKIKESGVVECSKCNTQYTTAVAYRDHCHTHSHPFQCEVCQKRFRKQGSVRFHSCRVKSEQMVCCDVCGRSFQHDRALEMHMNTHGTPNYSCDVCHRKFHQERFVRDHKCRMNEEVMADKKASHICHMCGKCFSTPSNLNKHMIGHTDQRAMCDLCNRPFHSKSYLKEHIAMVHENRYDYNCTYCDKVFKSRTGLQAHTKQFHGPTTHLFACVKCGKTFRQRGNLRTHMFSHSTSRDFKCPYCSKAFKYPDQLARHRLEHTVKERLKCDVCERTFIKGYDLRKHIEQSHSGMAYICSICDARCSFKHTLIRHFRRKHPSAAFRMENPAYVNSLLKPSTRPCMPIAENVISKTLKIDMPQYQQFPGSQVVIRDPHQIAIATNNGAHISYTRPQQSFYSILQPIDRNHLISGSPDVDSDEVSTSSQPDLIIQTEIDNHLPSTGDDTILERVIITQSHNRNVKGSAQFTDTITHPTYVYKEPIQTVSLKALEQEPSNENANFSTPSALCVPHAAAEALHSLSHSTGFHYQAERQVTNTVRMEDGTILDLDNLPADITTADGSHVIIMQIVDGDSTRIMEVEEVAEQTVVE